MTLNDCKACLLAFAMGALPAAALSAPAVGAGMDAAVIAGTNTYRVERGAPRLVPDQSLSIAAQAFADFYAANPGSREEWGHEYGGTTPFERARAAGYEGRCVGENIGWQGTTGSLSTLGNIADALVDGWIGSPPHQANLIHADFDQIGVGSARFELDGFTWIISVQMFGCAR